MLEDSGPDWFVLADLMMEGAKPSFKVQAPLELPIIRIVPGLHLGELELEVKEHTR